MVIQWAFPVSRSKIISRFAFALGSTPAGCRHSVMSEERFSSLRRFGRTQPGFRKGMSGARKISKR